MKTTLVSKESSRSSSLWYVVDASNVVLGKLAVKIANILRGKDRPIFAHHIDCGGFVIVTNAGSVKTTGEKNSKKKYMFYSMYKGNEKRFSLEAMRKRNPEFIIKHAVQGMLPRNRLSNELLKKLKVYRGNEHPHEAQQPVTLTSF
ncbi:MAG: 50S ribosomal protein L13 [Puniceicoccales bacterium]|jgi:large subunit ribosomal protein L13|nr:50S ribosomal protein L13 [Puniceicoccales bacterium]